jgi:hypothetical protein
MILVLDLDRTLNRLHPAWVRSIRDLAPAELRAENGRAFWDWIISHLAKVEYPPHKPALETLKLLCAEATAVTINTGRPEALRAVSRRWLEQFMRVDGIWMRGNDDFRPTAEVKRDNLESLLRLYPSDEVFAFDDNEAALRTYREAGVDAFWAPRCWDELLIEIRGRESNQAVASILRRYAAASDRNSRQVESIDQQDSGPARVKANDGNGGRADLDAQGEINSHSERPGNNGTNHIRMSNNRD